VAYVTASRSKVIAARFPGAASLRAMAQRRERAPRPERPHMPGYGLEGAKSRPGERIPWRRARERLVRSRCYWVVTARQDGRPHAVPVWGIWLDGELIFDSGRSSRKTRDLRANREMVVHLESGRDALILEGRAARLRERETLVRFARAYRRKYDYAFDPDDPPGIVFRFRPRVAFAFREELVETATRWRFRS